MVGGATKIAERKSLNRREERERRRRYREKGSNPPSKTPRPL